MTARKTKVLWADTIAVDLQGVFGWEVAGSGLGSYTVRVCDRLISSAESLVSSARSGLVVDLIVFQFKWLTFLLLEPAFPIY